MLFFVILGFIISVFWGFFGVAVLPICATCYLRQYKYIFSLELNCVCILQNTMNRYKCKDIIVFLFGLLHAARV